MHKARLDSHALPAAPRTPASLRGKAINRAQGLVLAFFLLAWAGVITILAVAPQVYDQSWRRAPGSLRAAETIFVIGLSALIGVIAFGIVRRWRWLFWLILAVFFLGVLRVPVTVLQFSGHIAASGPTWYVVLQSVVAVIQFAIALTSKSWPFPLLCPERSTSQPDRSS